MAGAIRGITVEIGGDTTKLGKALAEVNTKSKDLQKELKGVETLLKLNPGNVTLLKQKQDILNESIGETKNKLDILKQAMAQIDAGEVEVTAEEYRDLQREIISTEGRLESLTNQLEDFGSVGAQRIAAVGEKMTKVGDKISSAGKKMLPVTEVIAGLGGVSVKVAADFESSMSQVAATMGMTSEEINNGSEDYQKLEKAARDMGSATKYSASEAADALNYLALAGYDVDKSVETLPTILNLAAAGGIDLADASDMVTDAMSALGLETDQAEKFVDQMAKTSQKSNTNVAQLGEAILTVGGTAKNLAGGTTELNTALGILADNGIKGSEGGTALRNMILSLCAPTDTAAESIEALGLKVYDVEGNMRPLNDIFNDLNGTLSTMSQGEQTQVLNKIFNKVDLKSVNALLANSGERFDELSGYIENADGAASTMADTMNNNLSGQITILKSALEEAGISIGQALLPLIKKLVSVIQSLTDKFNNLSPATKMIIVIISGIVAAIGPLLIIVGKLISSVGIIMKAAPKIVSGIKMIGTGLKGLFTLIMAHPVIAIIGAIIAGVILLYNKCEWFRDGVNKVLSVIKDVVAKVCDALVTFFTETIPNAIKSVISFFQSLPGNIQNAISSIKSVVSDVFASVVDTVKSAISFFQSIPEKIYDALSALPSTIISIFENIYDLIAGVCERIKNFLPDQWSLLIDNIRRILVNFISIFENVFHTIANIVKSVVDIIKAIFSGDFASISGIISNIITEIKLFFHGLYDAVTTIIINMVAAVVNHIRGWVTTFVDIFTNLYTNLTAWWEDFKTLFITKAKEIINAVVTFFTELPDKIRNAINSAIQFVTTWATNVYNAATTWISNMVTTVIDFLTQLPGKIWNAISSAVTNVINWGKDMKSQAQTAISTLVTNVIDTLTQLPGKIVKAISGAIDNIVTWGSNMKSKAVSAMSDMASGIISTISDLPSRFMSIGSDIISGLWRGISGAVEGLYNNIKNALSGLVDKAKQALGIHSPSRVFRDVIGAMIPPGIALGIKKTENQATGAVDDMVDDLTNREIAINGATINRKLNTTFGNENVANATKGLDTMSLMNMLQNILDKLGSLQVILDTGELVGGMIDQIDGALDDKYNKTVRGW